MFCGFRYWLLGRLVLIIISIPSADFVAVSGLSAKVSHLGATRTPNALRTPPPKMPSCAGNPWLTGPASIPTPPPVKRTKRKKKPDTVLPKKASFKRHQKRRRFSAPDLETNPAPKIPEHGDDDGDDENKDGTIIPEDRADDDDSENEHGPMKHDVCLVLAKSLGVPAEALPQCPSRGSQNYTISGPSGAVVEVQLMKKAFWLKKYPNGDTFKTSQETGPTSRAWQKHNGVSECWELVKSVIGWYETEEKSVISWYETEEDSENAGAHA